MTESPQLAMMVTGWQWRFLPPLSPGGAVCTTRLRNGQIELRPRPGAVVQRGALAAECGIGATGGYDCYDRLTKIGEKEALVNAGSLKIVSGSDANLDSLKALFQEYWSSFGFTPCFQNFDAELATLPGKYQPPRGRLALALVGGQPGGCIALRPVDATRCEAKRLYVRPKFRGNGVGKALLEWLVAEARAAGYIEMVGDTMPVMERAIGMYEQMGFERVGAYAPQFTPGAIYIRLRL